MKLTVIVFSYVYSKFCMMCANTVFDWLKATATITFNKEKAVATIL